MRSTQWSKVWLTDEVVGDAGELADDVRHLAPAGRPGGQVEGHLAHARLRRIGHLRVADVQIELRSTHSALPLVLFVQQGWAPRDVGGCGKATYWLVYTSANAILGACLPNNTTCRCYIEEHAQALLVCIVLATAMQRS
jgi:hypothetical protein